MKINILKGIMSNFFGFLIVAIICFGFAVSVFGGYQPLVVPIVPVATEIPEAKAEAEAIIDTTIGLVVEENKEEKDIERVERVERVNSFIQGRYPTSPLNGEMIISTSDSYSIPEGFLMSIFIQESSMGINGRAVGTKNPGNIGNTDAGDGKSVNCQAYNWCLGGWSVGTDLTGEYIGTCHFNEGEPISLEAWIDRDFRTVSNRGRLCRGVAIGSRYMTNPNTNVAYARHLAMFSELGIPTH